MITLYNLKQSRSQRIAWLLEALNLPYNVQNFERDPVTKLAPKELHDIHPLGKSPLIKDNETIVAESGAIVEYILARYGNGKLHPDINHADYVNYLQWVHYAEGSAMPAMIMKYMVQSEAMKPFCDAQFNLHISYIENSLHGKTWFLGKELSGADIMMSFPLQFALMLVPKGQFPNIERFVAQVESNEYYRKACERVGELELKKLA
ncbi:glutathione S-transferase [uncultured Haemophilus sp.]|uniref:glutathione S-transferase family protein n=1 Tax=uncultured Haemophilus sp. TaxID=237779 RepID=UPI0028048F69|nr:glutathione S-transferase [uncultured Haemophilus sp.]